MKLCQDRAKDRLDNGDINAEQYNSELETCNERYLNTLRGETLIEEVDLDAIIGVDKTNLDHFLDPEELKDRICSATEFRKDVQKWIHETEKAETFFPTMSL